METVTIPREEYRHLVALAENAGDLDAIARFDAAMARGEEELIPAAFADRLLDGEAPLRVFRDLRSLTQSALAARSGVNRVQIADIEAGRKTGSVATLRKLADALGVTIDDIAA